VLTARLHRDVSYNGTFFVKMAKRQNTLGTMKVVFDPLDGNILGFSQCAARANPLKIQNKFPNFDTKYNFIEHFSSKFKFNSASFN